MFSPLRGGESEELAVSGLERWNMTKGDWVRVRMPLCSQDYSARERAPGSEPVLEALLELDSSPRITPCSG